MIVKQRLIDRDQYRTYQIAEQALIAGIIQAEIGEGFEEFLKIFDAFYADDIEVSSETQKEPIRGKPRVRSLLYNFLVPLHVMAELGGLTVTVRAAPILGDVSNETHSAWTLELVGASGAKCALSWSVLRKWNGSRIVYEHHYDHHQVGGPLTFEDLYSRGLEVLARAS
jgi:hypothetical protein